MSFTRNSSQDSAFLEVLARLSRTVRKERERLRTKVQSIALPMSSVVVKEGTILAVAVGSDRDFEMLNIAAARHQEEEAIASSNKWVKQLAEICKDFERIIGDVTQVMEVPVA